MLLIVGLVALAIILVIIDKPTQTQIDENGYNALVDLYSTNGANWENNTGWNETNTP